MYEPQSVHIVRQMRLLRRIVVFFWQSFTALTEDTGRENKAPIGQGMRYTVGKGLIVFSQISGTSRMDDSAASIYLAQV